MERRTFFGSGLGIVGLVVLFILFPPALTLFLFMLRRLKGTIKSLVGGIEDFKAYSKQGAPSEPKTMTTDESKAAFSTLIESLGEGEPPKPVEAPAPKTEEDDVPF